jgi:hypothetical protein
MNDALAYINITMRQKMKCAVEGMSRNSSTAHIQPSQTIHLNSQSVFMNNVKKNWAREI